MSLLRLQALGDVRLTREGGEVVVLRRAPLALLVFLARRQPRPVPRAELSALFWGERTEERARQSLRQALLELRQAVGEGIEVTPESVRLVPGALELDVHELERDAREGRDNEAIARWHGEFFPGAEGVGGAEFERWVDAERVALHRRLGTVFQQAIAAAEARGDRTSVLDGAERWAAALPLDEPAHARLVEALRAEHRAADAIVVHAEYVARLRTALDAAPSDGFAQQADALAELARSEAAERVRPTAGMRAPTLVGRAHVLAELDAAWRAAQAGTPRVVLLEDGGGCGKSRLCDEMAARHGAKAIVLRARGAAGAAGAAGDAGTPGAALATLLVPLRDARGLAGAAPEALAEVARVAPAVGAPFPHLPVPVGSEEALRDAIVAVLAAVGERRPVLVVVDDLHLADDRSRTVLAGVAARLAGRVLLLVTCDVIAHAERASLAALYGAPGMLRIRLPRLSPSEVEQLFASMVTLDAAARAPLALRLALETQGVPLLVYQLVATLVDQRMLVLDATGEWRVAPELEAKPLPLPALVRERVGEGLARLSPPARALLDAAAVLGSPIDGVLLEAVAGLTPAETGPALEELIARQLLLEEGTRHGRFAFAHPVISRVAYALLSPSERRALHVKAAERVSAAGLATTAERSTLPYHLARAGPAFAGAAPEPTAAADTPATDATRAARPRARRPLIVAAAAALLVVAVLAGSRLLARGERAAVDADARRVIVGAFENRSGRPELDQLRDIAVDWIVRGLDETGVVQIVGIGSGRDGERGRVAARASDSALRAVAREARAGTIVSGALHLVGDSVELEAMILDARDGSLLRALPAVRADAANPLLAMHRLREQVAGAVAALVDPAYEGGTGGRMPPSYRAYQAYMRGDDAYRRNQLDAALTAYHEAASSDPAYALPMLRIAYTSFNMQRCDRVDSIADVLTRRRATLSRFEELYLARVQAWCRDDWSAAHAAASRMADLAPNSPYAQFQAAQSAVRANRPRDALGRLERVDPADARFVGGNMYWVVAVFAQHMADDRRALQRARDDFAAVGPDRFTVGGRAYAAGALGDAAGLERAAEQMRGLTAVAGAADFTFILLGLDELRVHAGAAASTALANRLAGRMAGSIAAGAAGDTTRYILAELLYRAERFADARVVIDSMLVRHGAQWLIVGLDGRVAARTGDTTRARRAMTRLDELRDVSPRGSTAYEQAQVAALLGRPDEAVSLLQRALATGVNYMFAQDLSYLGHADMDLQSLRAHPTIVALLVPKG